MSATLTLELDAEVLRLADEVAQARHTTVPDLVRQHLYVLAGNCRASMLKRSPNTDALRGVLDLPTEQDYRKVLAEELSRSHDPR